MGYIRKETCPRTTPLLLTQRTCSVLAQLMENVSSPCAVYNMFKYNWTVFCSSVTVYFFSNGNVVLWFLTLVSLIGLVGWCMFTLAVFSDLTRSQVLHCGNLEGNTNMTSAHVTMCHPLQYLYQKRKLGGFFFSCCIMCCLFLQNCKSRNM